METNDNSKNKKKHADFQDPYRRSSNFNNPIKDEEFKIKKNGVLKIQDKKQKKELDESQKERIAEAMDSFKERTENTPQRGEDTTSK